MVFHCHLLQQILGQLAVVVVSDDLSYHDEELLEHVFVEHFLCVVGQLAVVEEVILVVVLLQLQHHLLQLQRGFEVRWIEALGRLQQEDQLCSAVYCC